MGDPAPGVWGDRERPARAIATDTLSDFGEGRIGYAASDWVEGSLAAATGRGTSAGHGNCSGQLAENHDMVRSYLRAVKETPSFKRSKNLQSPAASLETVEISRSVAFANSAAQVWR